MTVCICMYDVNTESITFPKEPANLIPFSGLPPFIFNY